MLDFDPTGEPMMEIAKALHRLANAQARAADALERLVSEDCLLGQSYLTVNLEPSNCEALRVEIEP